MLKWCFTFVLFGCFLSVAAQRPVSGDKRAELNYRKAMDACRVKDYDKAIGWLDKAAEYDADFPELYLLKADIFFKKGDEDSEAFFIRKALAIDSVRYPSYYNRLGDYYYSRGDYRNARFYFSNYLAKDKKQYKASSARKKLRNCEFAMDALAKQVKQEVIPFIRSDKNVYWPSLDVAGQTVLYTQKEDGEENIWMLRDSNRMALNLNTPDNEGTQSLTADGKMMYFTACGRRDTRGRCDIYVAYRLGDTTWSEPINLGFPVNTESWEAQPSISPDGTKLFFASNRDGGRGGSDIWFSRLLKREPNGRQVWSQPKCLYFNTPGDEMAPFFYYDNKTLFFSSDEYPGMGGKDIYKVDLDAVTEPLNIGITVNSHKDEMGFVVDASGEWGYFASDLAGVKNIYKYHIDPEIRCDRIAYMRLVTTDASGMPLSPDRLVVVAVASGDTLAFYDEVYAHDHMLACAVANQELLINASKRGYMYYSDTLHLGVSDYNTPRVKHIVLQRIGTGESLVLKGIFFDVDNYVLRKESMGELQRLVEFLELNPGVRIEISGHTDNSGSDEHNYKLSGARAFEVYQYLFQHRIAKDRMTYKGYGKDRPLFPNDTEGNRAKNRRTEIRIL